MRREGKKGSMNESGEEERGERESVEEKRRKIKSNSEGTIILRKQEETPPL